MKKYKNDEGNLSKNTKLLSEFSEYCLKYPELRFWQALQSWSKAHKILIMEDFEKTFDTFYFENKNN